MRGKESAKASSIGRRFNKLPNPQDKGQAGRAGENDFLDQLDRSLLSSAHKPRNIDDIRALAREDVK
jgi:hypothetical protein